MSTSRSRSSSRATSEALAARRALVGIDEISGPDSSNFGRKYVVGFVIGETGERRLKSFSVSESGDGGRDLFLRDAQAWLRDNPGETVPCRFELQGSFHAIVQDDGTDEFPEGY